MLDGTDFLMEAYSAMNRGNISLAVVQLDRYAKYQYSLKEEKTRKDLFRLVAENVGWQMPYFSLVD